MSEEKSVLRWGGLAGILAGILSILGFVILFVFVPTLPAGPKGLVASFPDARAATVVEESVYVSALILTVILFLALYRALRRGSLAPTLFGSGVGLLGLVLLAAGAVPAVAFSLMSDLYHASDATSVDQATIVLVWQGAQAIFNETDTVGFIFLTTGYILFGIAMFRNPTFSKRFGGVIMVLGLAGLVGVLLFSVASNHIFGFAPFAVIVLTVLPFLLGWKVYRLSTAAQEPGSDSSELRDYKGGQEYT